MSMELNLLQSLFWQGRCQSDVLFIQEMISCFPFQKRRDALKKKSTGITFGTDPVWPNHFWLTKCFILRIFIAILTVLGLGQRVLTLRLSDRRPVPVQGAPSLSPWPDQGLPPSLSSHFWKSEKPEPPSSCGGSKIEDATGVQCRV